jgi:phosphopantothenoylcysteine decarboxylase / phosphopantothenate---cysteine ligase
VACQEKGEWQNQKILLRRLINSFQKKKDKPLKGIKVLVNAGPTRENIDPVRFISNYSSGRMGVAVAEAAASFGATVDLVLGPVEIRPVNKDIRVVNVTSAASMADECIRIFKKCDIAILSAAVADFTPEIIQPNKIKRKGSDLVIRLKPTKDIASELGIMKKKNQILVGFALETNDEIDNAISKLKRKNLDLIVLNSMNDPGAGFGFNTNKITIIDKQNNIDKFELKSKEEAAIDIISKIILMKEGKV